MEWNKLLSTKRFGQTSESISISSDPYLRTLIATDLVAGMTDSCAVDLYQRIYGIALP